MINYKYIIFYLELNLTHKLVYNKIKYNKELIFYIINKQFYFTFSA